MTNDLTLIADSVKKLDLTQVNELCKKLLELDLEKVTSSLASQSYTFFFFSTVLSLLKKETEDCVVDLNTTMHQVREREQKNLEQQRKKVTEKYLESFVQADHDVIEVKRRLNDLECKQEICKSLVKALEQRRDMLIQMSSNRRAETKLIN